MKQDSIIKSYGMVGQCCVFISQLLLQLVLLTDKVALANLLTNYHGLLSMHELGIIAENFEESLFDLHRIYTSVDLLPKEDGRVVAEDVNAEEVLENVADQITELFDYKRRAVERVVERLELASESYAWEDELESNYTGVVVMNVTTELEFQNRPGVIDNLLGVEVNKSMPGIHVPLEVYEGYPEIVNGLKWSSVVDDVFKENSVADPTLAWQFFAAQTGFMRFYPSVTKWLIPPPYNPVDLFDARRRPWYIQGSTSPKDIIILMDRSGSVHGQTLTIMKFAIETLIDTLGENDFVNVAAFNETTAWISTIVHENEDNPYPWECKEYHESLLQATNINKRALVEDIQHLSVKGIANYSDALNFAFETFKKRSENGECGSGCHKLVMLFSDGGTEWPEDVFKRHLNDSATSDVRIFTYAVGPHPIPTAVLKKMACETGGQFIVITTSSGVRTKIQESYVSIIGEPLAASGSHVHHYTSLYTSAITQNLTISISLSVFNRSRALDEESQLIGVAGVDIPSQHLENLVPRETLGPLGYAFIINNNGILAMHPYIHTQESYLQNPPHLDLLDKELNEEKLEKVRMQMLNGERGVVTLSGLIFLDSYRVFPKASRKYTFMSIANTPYSLGISTSTPRTLRHLSIKSLLPVSIIHSRTSLLAPWNFCGVHPAFPRPDLVNKRILENVSQCNPELINSLMWAQEWTNELVGKWEQDSETAPEVISRAIFTRFGLARVVNGRRAFTDTNTSALTPLGAEWRDPIKNPAFRRGLLEGGMAIFTHRKGAFLSLPVFMTKVEAAVIGVNVSSKMLDKMIMDALDPVMPSNGSFVLVVDEAAVIVASSQYENSSGEFLGSRWPLLLEKLVEAGVFKRTNVTDYEALCSAQHEVGLQHISAADHLVTAFHPLNLITAAFANLLSLFEFLQCCMISLFVSISTSRGVDAIYKAGDKEACILQRTAYFLTEKRDFSGNISCLGDSAQVLVRRLNSTNALVVAVEDSLVNLSCDGWTEEDLGEQSFPLRSKRTRRVDPKEIACKKPRSRKRLQECKAPKPLQCSGSIFATANALLITIGLYVSSLKT